VLCRVVEAQKEKDSCNCGLDGRAEVAPETAKAVRAQLQASGNCGGANPKPCSDWCLCEIEQVDAAHLKACQTNQGQAPPGYCYVDEQAKLGADPSGVQAVEAQLAQCPVNQRQRLSFVDPTHQTPALGASTFIACLGAAIVSAVDGGDK